MPSIKIKRSLKCVFTYRNLTTNYEFICRLSNSKPTINYLFYPIPTLTYIPKVYRNAVKETIV